MMLYFYINQYEGGVCDVSMISMGVVFEQQFLILILWMVEKFGKKVYVIVVDYNFGQILVEWNCKIMKDFGGEVVGEEFILLGVLQFVQIIQNIQKVKLDWLFMINVGVVQDLFFEQVVVVNLNLLMGLLIKVMFGFEYKWFKLLVFNNMYVIVNWFEEIDMFEVIEFKKCWYVKFFDEFYINDMGYNVYNVLYMYKVLVEKVKLIKFEDMCKVIVIGDVCIDVFEGKVCIDLKS